MAPSGLSMRRVSLSHTEHQIRSSGTRTVRIPYIFMWSPTIHKNDRRRRKVWRKEWKYCSALCSVVIRCSKNHPFVAIGVSKPFQNGKVIKLPLGIQIHSSFYYIARGVDTDDHWQFRHACSEITYLKRYNVKKLRSEDHRYVVTNHTPDVPYSSGDRLDTICSHFRGACNPDVFEQGPDIH